MTPNETIKKRRGELKLTLRELGDKIGVTAGMIQRYECGYVRNIRFDRAKLLAEVLGVSAAEIMGIGEYAPEPTQKRKAEKEKANSIEKAGGILDIIERMAAMIEKGTITAEEFAEMKHKLLNNEL
jgi:transcriptional regulator with XRE-family HTH domain